MTKKNEKQTFRKTYTYAKFTAPKEVKTKFLAAKVENLNIVYFNPNDKFPVKGFSKVVLRNNKKTGSPFYGIYASKYGAKVPQDATHMAVAVFGRSKIERLYTMEIPAPLSKVIVEFGEGTNFIMLIRRSNKNIFISLGDTLQKKDKSESKLHKELNEKWIQL